MSRPRGAGRLRERSQLLISLFSPNSATLNARCSTSVFRPTRNSCVEAKNAPAISAPITTIASIATARAKPLRSICVLTMPLRE
jgi:hypothetical protein